MGAHRYWRFRNSTGTQANAGYFTCVRLGFYPNSHEADDVARTATATADAYYIASTTPDKAINGANSSNFQHSSATNGWLKLDFGAGKAYDLDHFEWCIEGYSSGANGPKDIQVEWSDDGTTWTLAWSITGLTWSANETKNFVNPSAPVRNPTTGAHRYWRLVDRSGSNAWSGGWCAIGEFVGRESQAGPQVFTGGVAAASRVYGSFVAANAFNGVNDQGWISDAADGSTWISYALPAGVTKEIKQIDLISRSDGYASQTPISFDIQWSDDNVSWKTKFHGFLPPFATAAQRQSYPLAYIESYTAGRRRQLVF